jgi:hypothetical protein
MTVNRSDFQKGRLASVSANDTIIVNDEDGTLEPQVIDFAGLAASAPFTGAFWPNSTTALTGANLANGDKLAVVDVGSPDVAKYITADELAQGSQFSSRYAPKAVEKVFLEASRGVAVYATPTLSKVEGSSIESAVQAFLFTHDQEDADAWTWKAPPLWATYDIYIWWTNPGAGSGDVAWYATTHDWGNGESTNADTNVPGGYNAPWTAPAQYVTQRKKLNSSAITCTAGDLQKLWLFRNGPGALTDTLGNDAAVFGVEFVRVS